MDLLPDNARRFRPAIFRARRLAWWMVLCGMTLVFAAVLGFVTAASAQPPASPPPAPLPQDTSTGKAIFEQKCIGCHTIGGGKLVGPDLKDVTKRRDLQWIKTFIQDPAKMLDTDPTAQQLLKDSNNVRMPSLGLTAAEIDQLAAFLGNPGTSPLVSGSAGAGDAAAGHLLFSGEKSLANGGPPCMTCHSASGIGDLGGGALGPDLTHVIQRLGEPGLTAALKTIAFPTMMGPFRNHPLSDKELADLVAFFKDRDRKQGPVAVFAPGSLTWNALVVFAIGLAISVVLFAVLAVLWFPLRKRYTPRLPLRKP